MLEQSKNKIQSYLGAESKNGPVLITAANLLTMLRLAIVPIFWYAFLSKSLWLEILATFFFILGALTDLWDGKLARKHGAVTPFGNFMDPFADKLLVLSAFWALLIREDFSGLFIIALIWILLITLRETGLTVMRIAAIRGGSSVITSFWGKLKNTVQLTTIIFTLLALNLRDFLIQYQYPSTLFDGQSFFILVNVLLFLSALVSLLSGGFYLRGKSIATSRSD